MANIQFKSDNQNQSVLFPSRLDENIPAIHPVRIVNEIVDKLDIRDLLSEYKGGGTSAYHPRMLLKILIYGYLNNLYSSAGCSAVNGEYSFYVAKWSSDS